MKFPKKLSKERISLLSPEDKKIYEYEHSVLSAQPLSENLLNEVNVDTDIDSDNLDESYLHTFFTELIEDNDLKNELSKDEYKELKDNVLLYINENINKFPNLSTLNEVSSDYWLSNIKLGWLGKLSAGLLTGLVGIVAWLFMKGKDKLAMIQLKKYMNKLVELTDSGVNKKRPWYSFLMPTKKGRQNTGDYDKACFRTIQETAERNLACLYTQCIFSLGYFSPNRTSFNDITSNFTPEEGSGLSKFIDICNKVNSDATAPYLNGLDVKLLPFKPNTDYFNNIDCPAIPTNYSMLMADIDYPTKAKQNPNGSLFMKPSVEILQAKGEDLGQVYFSDNTNITSIVNMTNTANENYNIFNTNFILNKLFEVEQQLQESDLDPTNGFGVEINQETEKRHETTVNYFQGNLVDAIDNYVRSSITSVVKLLRAISGDQSDRQDMKELIKTITTLNNAAEGNISEFMKKHDAVLHDIQNLENKNKERQLTSKNQVISYINVLQTIILNNRNEFYKVLGIQDIKKQAEFENKLLKIVFSKNTSIDDLDDCINNYSKISSFNDLINKLNNLNNPDISKILNNLRNKRIPDDFNESYNLLYNHILNEDDDNNDKILSILKNDVDNIYNSVKNKLTEHFSVLVENNPENWYIIKNSRDRMKNLKEAANKEITAKIELICRTASGEHSSLGDKFKAALSKHPVRAEALKNIWARYYDDLEDKIESRIRSITGDNGNSNILTTIKNFLRVTYPNLIATLLYYKQIYYLIKIYTEKYPISSKSAQTISDEITENNLIKIKTFLNSIVGKYQDRKNQAKQTNT